MREHVRRNLLGRAPRLVVPVVGIDAIADRDVAQVLRNFQRAHLIGRVRLFVDGVRRTHQRGANAHQAAEEPFGQIQFHFHVGSGNIAHIGMGEGVVPDCIAFFVDAFRDARKSIGFDADEEKCRSRMFFLERIENLRRPLRIGPVIEGECNFVWAVAVASHAVRFR